MDTHVTLQNLGVIAELSQNDKMNTKSEYFTIYIPTTFRGMARFIYYGEGRDDNISKITLCIHTAKEFILKYLNELHTDTAQAQTFLQNMEISKKKNLCKRMLAALEQSIKGLMALKTTYKDDASSHSKLQCLILEIEDFLEATKQPDDSDSGRLRYTS
jgi:hypothetical protein